MTSSDDRRRDAEGRRGRSPRRSLLAWTVAAIVLVAALAALAAWYGLGSRKAAPDTGVRGVVLRVALRDAAHPSAAPSGEPASALITVRDLNGVAVSSATSHADGTFTIVLPPGRYRLAAVSPVDTALPVSQPLTVTVPAHGFTQVTLTLPAAPGPVLATPLPTIIP